MEWLGRVGKFSCQHGIHVDPAGRKTNMYVVALRNLLQVTFLFLLGTLPLFTFLNSYHIDVLVLNADR